MKGAMPCRVFAHACSMAVILDALVPRPGLFSFSKPRKDIDPMGFVALSPIAYETCLCSCDNGAELAHMSTNNEWCRCWLRAVRRMRKWGNPGLGSLFLLSLQAASLGYAYEKLREVRLENVMGSSRIVIESCGTKGARYFYDALYMVRPSYLGRISWLGLPDATQRQSSVSISLYDLAWLGALYDNVLRDASRLLELSLGIALPELRRWPCIALGVKKATYLVAGLFPDFLLRRKTGEGYEDYWMRAYVGDPGAENLLYEELGSRGPGSVADIVVNALARYLFEAMLLGSTVSLLC